MQAEGCWDVYNQELDFLSQWAQEAVAYDSENLCPNAYLDSDFENQDEFDDVDDLDENGGRRQNCPVKRLQQRAAANQRERKRMRSINCAFDGLKCRIPISPAEKKKLSKVDTLKYAIQYIQKLTDVLADCDDTLAFKRRDRKVKQEKVILKCKTEPLQDGTLQDETDIFGHSLSWSDDSTDIKLATEKKLIAKLWVPESAQIVDDSMMFGLDPSSPDYSSSDYTHCMSYNVMPDMIPAEQMCWGYSC